MLSQDIIHLQITPELKNEDIIQTFVKNKTNNTLIIELSHKYHYRIITIPIKIKKWSRFVQSSKLLESSEGKLKSEGISNYHIDLIKNTIEYNFDDISGKYDKDSEYLEDVYQDTFGSPMPDFSGNGKGISYQKKTISKIDDEKEEKEDKKTYSVNKYSQGISLAESILIENIPYFIQINNGMPYLSQKIKLTDIDIVPPTRTEYLSREFSFSSSDEINYFFDLANQETLDSLFQRVKVLWKKYIDIEEDFINICAADTIFTYFQDRIGMTHYLLIVGDNNTGKSNILLLFSILGYRSLYDTSITPANIYNFCRELEEGQGIIIEDEIDDIDYQHEKKKLYKVSYRSGTKVTRMYDNNGSIENNKRKLSRQQGFFLFGFKMFASEKIPDNIKSKGFLERLIILKSISGDPQFDISEVVNDAGDEQFKQLYLELMHTRKLLLMYRLIHYNDSIPNIQLNIKNRYKQLTKPLIRLFQNTQSLDEIIKSLSRYVKEKNEEKINSFDSALLFLIIDLIAEYGLTLYNDQIWEKIKEKFTGTEIAEKPFSYFIEEYGSISKTKITNTCETKFGAKQHRDKKKGRGLIFNLETLNKLSANYSIIDQIKIIKGDSNTKKNGDTSPTRDTFTECTDKNIDYKSSEDIKKTDNSKTDYEEKIEEKYNLELKPSKNIDEIIDKNTDRNPP